LRRVVAGNYRQFEFPKFFLIRNWAPLNRGNSEISGFPDPSTALIIALRAAPKPKQKRTLTTHDLWWEDNIQKHEDRASEPVERSHSSTWISFDLQTLEESS